MKNELIFDKLNALLIQVNGQFQQEIADVVNLQLIVGILCHQPLHKFRIIFQNKVDFQQRVLLIFLKLIVMFYDEISEILNDVLLRLVIHEVLLVLE